MRYRVAVYADDLAQWVHVGPVFTSRDDAVRFLDTFATPFKRLVQMPFEEAEAAQASPVDALESLDRNRLEFVRYLVQTGRIHDGQGARTALRAAA